MLLYLRNTLLSSMKFRKTQKSFRKSDIWAKKAKTKRTEYPLCVCGRGSKSRTHGTRFWRPLLYQLSYTPKSMPHSLNACLLYKIRRKMSSINFQVLVLQPQQPSLAAGRLWSSWPRACPPERGLRLLRHQVLIFTPRDLLRVQKKV